MRPFKTNPGLRFASIYFFAGSIWVLIFDLLSGHFAANTESLFSLRVLATWGLVVVTTILFYFLIDGTSRKTVPQTDVVPGDNEFTRNGSNEAFSLAHEVYEKSHQGITITDPQGDIVAINPAFSAISGYEEEEVLGKNPRIFQSGFHSKAFYHEMWASITNQDRWAGEIWNRRKDGQSYPAWLTINAVRDEYGKLANYIGFFTDLSRLKRSEEQLLFQANHDPLTKLPNRNMFYARMKQAIAQARRHNYMLAVMILDLDGFRDINDSFGLKVGDRLLQNIADKISSQLRAEDIVARQGGDELLIALNEINEAHQVVEVTEKIRNALNVPWHVEGHDIFITACGGISLYPENGDTPEQLIGNADAALYRAKEEGPDQIAFYSESFTRSALERITILSGLRMALEQNELELHYQPQVYSHNRELAGVEALLRWQHPMQGLIMPDQFIPLAEQSGLIRELGDWVLREACRQITAWRKTNVPVSRIAVNLSAKQLGNDELIKTLETLLQEFHIEPAMLELELTETAIMANPEATAKTLAAASALGFSLAVDDFGTGYSSLSYLQQLHPQRLKIDRTFVRGIPVDENSAAICRTIIAMANSLGMETVAEGIEQEVQCEFMQAECCTICQGWLYAKAMPAAELEEWLRNR